MRKRIIAVVFILSLSTYASIAQCPTSDTGGSVSLTTNCTISSNLTVNGDLVISNSSTLTVNPGVVLTITGNLQSAYQSGVITVNGGGSINVGGLFLNEVRTSTSFTFSNVTVSVNNVTTAGTKNDYTSRLYLTNGTSLTIEQGNFENDNGTYLGIDNSSLIVESGNVLNDFQATIAMTNGGSLSINNGNLQTEDQSTLSVDASDIYINGDFNNDYNANLNVTNGSSFEVTGDFNNGYDPSGGEVTVGHVNIDGSDVVIGGNLNNDYGSDLSLDNGGSIAVTGDVNNDQAASIDVTDGTFSYGGTMTDPHGGVSAGSGDSECSDGCCGSGCAALPVELTSFQVQLEENTLIISWSTSSELNNDHFNLFRSNNGQHFDLIQTVAGYGTTNEPQQYSVVDYPERAGMYYYRLEQVDFDGQNEIFPTRKIHFNPNKGKQKLAVYPVPLRVDQNLQLDYHDSNETISAQLFDLSGNLKHEVQIERQGQRITYKTENLGLKSGIYILRTQIGIESFSQKIRLN